MTIGVSPAAGFFAHDDDRPVGYVHVAHAENDAPDRWSVGLVVDAFEDGQHNRREITTTLLQAAKKHVAKHGGGTLVVWRHVSDPANSPVEAALDDAGFHVARELFQMRVPLPIDERPQWPAGVSVRTFEPGTDDAQWLAVNNRAFANHVDQGGWTEETLRRRMAEPWFDPSLFFVAVDGEDGAGGAILGFNWCKVHPETANDPALGEIYVIGVDPRAKGRKIGRPLALTGLDAMAQRGMTTGMLYCAADNEPALRLYRSLGYHVHRVDRAYECSVQP